MTTESINARGKAVGASDGTGFRFANQQVNRSDSGDLFSDILGLHVKAESVARVERDAAQERNTGTQPSNSGKDLPRREESAAKSSQYKDREADRVDQRARQQAEKDSPKNATETTNQAQKAEAKATDHKANAKNAGDESHPEESADKVAVSDQSDEAGSEQVEASAVVTGQPVAEAESVQSTQAFPLPQTFSEGGDSEVPNTESIGEPDKEVVSAATGDDSDQAILKAGSTKAEATDPLVSKPGNGLKAEASGEPQQNVQGAVSEAQLANSAAVAQSVGSNTAATLVSDVAAKAFTGESPAQAAAEPTAKTAVNPELAGFAKSLQQNTAASDQKPSATSETLADAELDALDSAQLEVAKAPGLDKLSANKAMAAEMAPLTPVQERLAALAKSLDKSAQAPEALGRKENTKAAIESLKSIVTQRGADSINRPASDPIKPVTTQVGVPMQSREWPSEVGQRLMMMVASKIQSAQIHLNPKNLGPMEVKVTMQQDQAQVVFTSHVAQTREALEQALPRLREMFDQNGVGLGNVDVRDQGTSQSGSEGHRQQSSATGLVDGESEMEGGLDSNSTPVPVGLVDYYA